MGKAPIKIRLDFANRLQRAMAAKGYTSSELARRAQDYLPVDPNTGKRMHLGRDNLSMYTRAKCLPNSERLSAIVQALDMRPDELLPTRSGDGEPAWQIRSMGNGQVWLQVDQIVTREEALEIAAVLTDSSTTER